MGLARSCHAYSDCSPVRGRDVDGVVVNETDERDPYPGLQGHIAWHAARLVQDDQHLDEAWQSGRGWLGGSNGGLVWV